jgi:hypothetical protein
VVPGKNESLLSKVSTPRGWRTVLQHFQHNSVRARDGAERTAIVRRLNQEDRRVRPSLGRMLNRRRDSRAK